MKTKFLSLVLLTFLMISCQNDLEKDLNLHIITSSKLSVTVVDSKGTSLSNVNIKLYDKAILSSSSSSSTYSSLEYIYSKSTDSNGKVDFGDIASGTYFILIDSVRINGLNYQPIMQFQVNSTIDKNITINPEEYITTYNFNIQKTATSKTSNLVNISAFNNLNVAFIPYTSYSSYYSLNKLISLAEVSGKTNDAGYVSLKVPAFRSYISIVYNDAKTAFSQLVNSGYPYSSSPFSGDKGVSVNLSYSLDFTTLVNTSYGVYNLSIKKAISSPTSTSPILLPFEGLNVAAIPGTAYDSSLPLSILLESVELSGKTDAAGNISFSLKSDMNYQFIVYNNDKTTYSTLSNSSNNSFYVNTGETKQTTFMINPTTFTPVTYARVNATFNKTASVYYTPNPTDLTPFSNLKVALVPYLSNNSGTSIDNLLSTALASGTTDANGQISFVLATSSNYSMYYQIVAYDNAKTTKFVSSSISVYSGSSNSLTYNLNAISLVDVN
jgi:hypothetical protein